MGKKERQQFILLPLFLFVFSIPIFSLYTNSKDKSSQNVYEGDNCACVNYVENVQDLFDVLSCVDSLEKLAKDNKLVDRRILDT